MSRVVSRLPVLAVVTVVAASACGFGEVDDLVVGTVADDETPCGGDACAGGAAGASGGGAVDAGGDGGTTLGLGGGDPSGPCTSIVQQTDNLFLPADIIIAVDQSTSMTAETGFVQAQLNSFAASVTGQGIDAHIVLIAEQPDGVKIQSVIQAVPSCVPEETFVENPICIPEPLAGPDCSDSDRFRGISCHVDSTDAYESVLDTFPLYADFLREDSVKHVVVISDDRPVGITAQEFRTELESLRGGVLEGFLFHGIVQVSCGNSGDYLSLVAVTNGVAGDLCEQDFQPVWDRIVDSIRNNTELVCEWDLPPAPEGQVLDPDRINLRFTSTALERDLGNVGSAAGCRDDVADGWYYDDPDAPTKVIVCPSICSRIRSVSSQRMDIEFGCQTRVIVPQ